jgi:hypothetical protein
MVAMRSEAGSTWMNLFIPGSPRTKREAIQLRNTKGEKDE